MQDKPISSKVEAKGKEKSKNGTTAASKKNEKRLSVAEDPKQSKLVITKSSNKSLRLALAKKHVLISSDSDSDCETPLSKLKGAQTSDAPNEANNATSSKIEKLKPKSPTKISNSDAKNSSVQQSKIVSPSRKTDDKNPFKLLVTKPTLVKTANEAQEAAKSSDGANNTTTDSCISPTSPKTISPKQGHQTAKLSDAFAKALESSIVPKVTVSKKVVKEKPKAIQLKINQASQPKESKDGPISPTSLVKAHFKDVNVSGKMLVSNLVARPTVSLEKLDLKDTQKLESKMKSFTSESSMMQKPSKVSKSESKKKLSAPKSNSKLQPETLKSTPKKKPSTPGTPKSKAEERPSKPGAPKWASEEKEPKPMTPKSASKKKPSKEGTLKSLSEDKPSKLGTSKSEKKKSKPETPKSASKKKSSTSKSGSKKKSLIEKLVKRESDSDSEYDVPLSKLKDSPKIRKTSSSSKGPLSPEVSKLTLATSPKTKSPRIKVTSPDGVKSPGKSKVITQHVSFNLFRYCI